MLLLIISATYAYFSVTITGNGSKSMITANTPKKHSLSVSTLYDDIHIHVDNEDMKLVNVGSYYGAVNDNRYETDLTTGTHQIIEVSSKGMENIRYSCSGDIKVTLNIDNGSMGSVLEKEDVLLYLKGLGLDETLDLSTLKMNNTQIYKTTFEIDGDSSNYLSAIVELVNKQSYQNYIANKMLNVSVEAENMVCKENGTYKYMVTLHKNVSDKQNDKETNKTVSIFYDEKGVYQKIQNIYLVDYINTSKAIKTWKLGDTERGTKLDEVMGWLEKTPNEDDRYDLYIGSNGPMCAPKDMDYAFNSFTNLKKISGDALDTSEVTNMSRLFSEDINLIDINALSSWDTSSVTDMSWTFSGCTILDNINPLQNWDVSSVRYMSATFSECKNLGDINALTDWDVSNVVNMGYSLYHGLFKGTKISDLMPLKNWNISKVKNMTSMFSGTQITDISALANWNTSSVTGMHNMFSSTSINDISPLSTWDVSHVTTMKAMFNDTQVSDLAPLKDWNMSEAVDISGMFQSTKISDITPIINWDISKVTNMGGLFRGCANLTDISPIAKWDVSQVNNVNTMFVGTNISNLTPLSTWDVSRVTNMSNMFQNLQINDLMPISNWDIQNVTNMSYMFSGSGISDLTPLQNWNTSKVTDMTNLFASCSNLKNLNGLETWKTENVTKMGGMFVSCTNLENIDAINNWNVSNVTQIGGNYHNGSGLFQNCTNLTKVDLSNWLLSKVTDISRVFANCKKLTELKLPKGLYNNISDIKNYSGIFGGQYTTYFGDVGTMATVLPNITVYTESSQMDWVETRLQEALGENNNSTVLTYE